MSSDCQASDRETEFRSGRLAGLSTANARQGVVWRGEAGACGDAHLSRRSRIAGRMPELEKNRADPLERIVCALCIVPAITFGGIFRWRGRPRKAFIAEQPMTKIRSTTGFLMKKNSRLVCIAFSALPRRVYGIEFYGARHGV